MKIKTTVEKRHQWPWPKKKSTEQAKLNNAKVLFAKNMPNCFCSQIEKLLLSVRECACVLACVVLTKQSSALEWQLLLAAINK